MPRVSLWARPEVLRTTTCSRSTHPTRDYGHFFPVLPPKFDINSLSEAWLSFASEVGLSSEESFDVLFFGGDGSGCTWGPADLQPILELIKSSFDQTGRRWLISTSRRTPLWLEQELRHNIPEATIADACWFGQGDQRRVVQPYLGAASRVFVSMDSATMMHEALFQVAQFRLLVTSIRSPAVLIEFGRWTCSSRSACPRSSRSRNVS